MIEHESITDHDSGTTYTPVIGGPFNCPGYRYERNGVVRFIFLNASDGSDDGAPTVFLYDGAELDPAGEAEAWSHFDLTEETA